MLKRKIKQSKCFAWINEMLTFPRRRNEDQYDHDDHDDHETKQKIKVSVENQ